MIYFRRAVVPCVVNAETIWHLEHGWIWNAYRGEREIGVFFCTLLCGEGCVIHFEVCGKVSGWDLLSGVRKAVRMVIPCFSVVYATVPRRRKAVLAVLKRNGFAETDGGFERDGEEVVLLKLLPKF